MTGIKSIQTILVWTVLSIQRHLYHHASELGWIWGSTNVKMKVMRSVFEILPAKKLVLACPQNIDFTIILCKNDTKKPHQTILVWTWLCVMCLSVWCLYKRPIPASFCHCTPGDSVQILLKLCGICIKDVSESHFKGNSADVMYWKYVCEFISFWYIPVAQELIILTSASWVHCPNRGWPLAHLVARWAAE